MPYWISLTIARHNFGKLCQSGKYHTHVTDWDLGQSEIKSLAKGYARRLRESRTELRLLMSQPRKKVLLFGVVYQHSLDELNYLCRWQ